jgi:hypothetical protein
MYLLTIILLMFIFPFASVLLEMLLFKTATGIIFLIGKWFVFWAVGIRLLVSGLRQSTNPKFTAEQIFGIKNNEPLVIVQELGFANLSIGILATCVIFNNSWVVPSAIVGGLFYGFAGVKHLTRRDRNLFENSAMISDLLIFTVLLIYLIGIIAHSPIAP